MTGFPLNALRDALDCDESFDSFTSLSAYCILVFNSQENIIFTKYLFEWVHAYNRKVLEEG
jgi:hypothetical protein